MIRLRQTVSRQVTNKHLVDQKSEDALLEPRRQRRPRVRKDIGRLSEDVLRHEVIAAPEADVRLGRVTGGLTRDVCTRIAPSDYKHSLVAKTFGRLECKRMQLLAVKR